MSDETTMRALRRAARRADRAAAARDALLLEARGKGASFDVLANVTGWDRRTVSRYLAKLAADLEAQGFTVHIEGQTLRAEGKKNHGA